MVTNEEKQTLCTTHHDLLYLIYHYGNGAFLLPQLRTLATALHLYPSEQAVGTAVRELKNAGILKRMTWLDGRSDLVIGCKYLFRYFTGCTTSQEVAAAKKYNSPRQYMVQCCSIDFLIRLVEKHPDKIKSLDDISRYLDLTKATIFLRAPDLQHYFLKQSIYAQYNTIEYNAQLHELERLNALRFRMNDSSISAPPPPLFPIKTLETLHRRNIYIVKIVSQKIFLVRYDFSNTLSAKKIMDWALDAYFVLHSLLPDREIIFCIQTLSENGQADLIGQLSAPYHGRPYQQARLSAQHIDNGLLSIRIENSHVMERWLGGVHVLI